MTDIYTVTFTQTVEGVAESIPWQFTFADLDLAKAHVLEEAEATRQLKRIGDGAEHEGPLEWTDYEEYSTLVDDDDSWLVVRTELVEKPPSGELSPV